MMTGDRIKSRRKELGMNAETLAAECGLAPATIYRYEKGDIENMGIDKIRPIADALHTTAAYLMGWDDDPIDYESDGDLIAEIPASYIKAANGDVKKAYKMMLAVDGDAQRESRQADSDLQEYLEALRARPEMRMLFSVSKDATKEDIEKAVAIIEALRKTEGR